MKDILAGGILISYDINLKSEMNLQDAFYAMAKYICMQYDNDV